jgi:tetratricopeptide (TPR) repeat protein
LFFKVAEIYQNKNNYVKAIEFYKKGLAVAGTNIIIVNHYRNLAISYFHYAREVKSEKRQYFEEAINIFDKYIVKSNENELTLHDYNNRAISFMWIGDVENEKDSRHMYFKKAFNDFSKAIEISKSNATLFYNRSKLMKKMEMIKECLEDLIEAEFIASNEKYINDVINLIKGNIELLDYCVRIILEKSDDKSSGDNLIKRLEEYGNNFKEQTPEIATTLERLHL